MIFIYILLILLVLLVLAAELIYIGIIFFGPPFIPTPMSRVEAVLKEANLTPKDTLIDLGSGDGRLLIAAAKKGSKAIGWELNPFLVLWTKVQAYRAGVSSRVQVHLGSYANASLKEATVVFIYLFPHIVEEFEKRQLKELRAQTTIISYKFPLSVLKPTKVLDKNMFIYHTDK